jgi:hypothetical protein
MDTRIRIHTKMSGIRNTGFNTFFLQGFNRIAAIALLFMNEEDAFWCLVYIVEQLMPPQYYSKQLVGAQVDQVPY